MMFRSSTGEGWNALLHAMRSNWDFMQDCKLDPTLDDFLARNKPVGCGSESVFGFFQLFVILVQQILLNLFIAVVLQAFSDSSKEERLGVTENDIEGFIDKWQLYDPNATELLPLPQLDEFLCSLNGILNFEPSTFDTF